MEPCQGRAFEAGQEHFTQKSIIPGVEDHRLVEMQHVIVRIGGVVVHGEGRYREATGRVIIQNMLTERRREHVLWSSEGGGEKPVWGGSNPEGRVHGWYQWGDAPGSLGRIFMSWLRLASVPAGFSPYPALQGTNGSVGSTRGLFFWIGLPRRSGMVNVVGAESCRKIIRHPPVGQCRRVQWPPCLYRDEMEGVGGEVPVIYRSGRPPTGFAGACYPPVIGSGVRATRPPAWPAPLVLPPSFGARGGTGLQGEGLLGCWT